MAHFTVDIAKLKEVGGGSVKTFCERNGLPRCDIYQVDGRKCFRDGSKGQRVAEKLIALGIGKWVNDEKVVKSA